MFNLIVRPTKIEARVLIGLKEFPTGLSMDIGPFLNQHLYKFKTPPFNRNMKCCLTCQRDQSITLQ